MNTEWITDRLPREEDGSNWLSRTEQLRFGQVWLSNADGVYTTHWSDVKRGQPWQHIQHPAPYVKPKRWTVEWFDGRWEIREHGEFRGSLPYSQRDGEIVQRNLGDEYAQKIEDIYNEVMP